MFLSSSEITILRTGVNDVHQKSDKIGRLVRAINQLLQDGRSRMGAQFHSLICQDGNN